LSDLSNDLVVAEFILFWDLAIRRLVENMVIVMSMVAMMEQVGDPAGIDGSEEGKKCKFVHLKINFIF